MYVERTIDNTVHVYEAGEWLGQIIHDHNGPFVVDRHGNTRDVAAEAEGITLLTEAE